MPLRAFIDSEFAEIYISSEEDFVLMPLRAFIDSELKKEVQDVLHNGS